MNNQSVSYHSTDEIKPLLEEIRQIIFQRLERDPNITTQLLLVCGLINKAYELTETAIWAIDNNRPQTVTFMLRGLYETLAFTYHVKNKISRTKPEEYHATVSKLLLGTKKPDGLYPSVNILTCIDKASKEFVNLRKNYDDLSELVHPNSASHFYVANPENEQERTMTLKIPFYQFKQTDKEKSLNQIGECCFHIIRLCKDLL